jgi:hypothetical protein
MPRRDAISYVIAVLVLLLELPILAVLALAALVTRVAVAIASSLRRAVR